MRNVVEILITQWALDAYLQLKGENVFSLEEYKTVIRPDVRRLYSFPNDSKFRQSKFWSVAQEQGGKVIQQGYKMKWHQIGEGRVQLRLTVGIFDDRSFLCEAYVKRNSKQEIRQLARLKTFLELIRRDRYKICGRLT